MNFITLKELKKMVPVASEFKRVPGLKKILEDGIEVILRKQMENHAEVVVYKNGYVSYHAHERYTVFALHNCTHYYYESQGYTSSLTFRLQRSDGSEVEKLHTAWTQKGRKFLYHTLKRRGVLPLAEQGG